jgi:hypothetical protein
MAFLGAITLGMLIRQDKSVSYFHTIIKVFTIAYLILAIFYEPFANAASLGQKIVETLFLISVIYTTQANK